MSQSFLDLILSAALDRLAGAGQLEAHRLLFAVGMLVQVAILRPPRAAESARPWASVATVHGGPAAAVDPWGESIPSEAAACDSEPEVCMDQALALSAPVSDPCASAQVSASVDWQESGSGLEGGVDAVCVSDAI